MASVTFTITANSSTGGAGEVVGGMIAALQQIKQSLPDKTATGASTVITASNSATGGNGSFQVTSGPYQTGAVIF